MADTPWIELDAVQQDWPEGVAVVSPAGKRLLDSRDRYTMQLDLRDDQRFGRDLDGVAKHRLHALGEDGLPRVGARLLPGDVLVGRGRPKPVQDEKERLLQQIFGDGLQPSAAFVPFGRACEVVSVQDVAPHQNAKRTVEVVYEVHVPVLQGDELLERDGRRHLVASIRPFEGDVGVNAPAGTRYFKRGQRAWDVLAYRTIGPCDRRTKQPTSRSDLADGQIPSEATLRALLEGGHSWVLREFTGLRSDDEKGRLQAYEELIKGRDQFPGGEPRSALRLRAHLLSAGLQTEFGDTAKLEAWTPAEDECLELPSSLSSSLAHPWTGRPLQVVRPIPDDLREPVLDEPWARLEANVRRLRRMLELSAPQAVLMPQEQEVRAAVAFYFDALRKVVTDSLSFQALVKPVDFSGACVVMPSRKVPRRHLGVPWELARALFLPQSWGWLIEQGHESHLAKAKALVMRRASLANQALEAVTKDQQVLAVGPSQRPIALRVVALGGATAWATPLAMEALGAAGGARIQIHALLDRRARQQAAADLTLGAPTQSLPDPPSGWLGRALRADDPITVLVEALESGEQDPCTDRLTRAWLARG